MLKDRSPQMIYLSLATVLIILLLVSSCSKPKVISSAFIAPLATPTTAPDLPREISSIFSTSVYSSMGSGTYSDEFLVTLTAGVGSQIYYCVSNTSLCDPTAEGELYSGPIQIGDQNTEGEFYLRFVEVFPDNKHSDIFTEYYNIVSDAPALTIDYPTIYLQTSQKDRVARMTSSLMGQNNLSFSLLNTGDSQYLVDCQNYLNSFPPAAFGLLSAASNKTSDLSLSAPGDYLTFRLDPGGNLSYGSNFLVGVLSDNTDPENPSLACQRQKIVLRDFTFFANEANSISDGESFSGAFIYYASPAYVGGESTILKSGFTEVVK